MKRQQKRRRRSVLVLYWLLVGVIVLAIPEAAVRLFRLQGDSYTRPDPELGWSHIPGKSGLYLSPQARARFQINAQGMMGPARPLQKPEGKRRVLLLGDSFTEALQVPYPQSWAALLQRELGPDWEVLNGGVSGYGTDNELLFYTTRGSRYEPDVVFLLFFTGNDYSDNDHVLSLRTGQSLPKPYFTLENDTLRLHDFPVEAAPGRLGRWVPPLLKEKSRFYLFLRTRLHEWRVLRRPRGIPGSQVPLAWEVYRRDPQTDWRRSFDITERLIGRLRRETDSRGARRAVGILPTGWRVDEEEFVELLGRYPSLGDTLAWDFSEPDRRMAEILRRHGVPGLMLSDSLRAVAAREGVRLYGDHLTVRGHQVVAREVAGLIQRLDSGAP